MNLITFSYEIALAGCHCIYKRPYNNSKLHPTCVISKLANHCDLALKGKYNMFLHILLMCTYSMVNTVMHYKTTLFFNQGCMDYGKKDVVSNKAVKL
jgi:hypothetical protein